jgi:hypothetical protein
VFGEWPLSNVGFTTDVEGDESITIGEAPMCMRLTRGLSGPGDTGANTLWSLTVEINEDGLCASTNVWLGRSAPSRRSLNSSMSWQRTGAAGRVRRIGTGWRTA